MLKTTAFTSTLLLGLLWVDSAFALSLWDCIPIIPPPHEVPEIDASSGMAAIALVMSFGAVLHRKLRG